ncbi:MAG TPA: hypothetical protein VJP78_09345, partial [Thermoleophilia bacterium]|nr:hypothetical protein [Thermoleophilia bacterium]
ILAHAFAWTWPEPPWGAVRGQSTCSPFNGVDQHSENSEVLPRDKLPFHDGTKGKGLRRCDETDLHRALPP